MRRSWPVRFVDPKYPLSELTRDVIAGFYRTYDVFGFGFLESVYKRALSVELRLAGLEVEREVPLGLVLFFGPKPKVKRVIRASTREYPVTTR